MNELKPCPFCGSNRIIEDIVTDNTGAVPMTVWRVKCTVCGSFKNSTSNPDRARKRWNTRPAENALDKEVDSLVLCLAKIKQFCKQQHNYYTEREKTDIPELKLFDKHMAKWCKHIIEMINSVCTEKEGENEQ